MAGQAPQQSPQDNHMAPLWLTVGLFIVLFLIWYFFRIQLTQAFITIKMLEAKLIGLFTHKIDPVQAALMEADPSTLPPQVMLNIANIIGRFIAIPVVVLLLVAALFLMKRSASSRFKQIYTMKSLLKAEHVNWPQITPVVNLDLVHEDINAGPWAMAKTPMQFAKMHQLLKEQRMAPDENLLAKDVRIEVVLLKQKATQVFVKQLGPTWQGVEALNPYTKALFAVFAARIAEDINGANNLLMQIAASTRGKTLNFAGTKELLERHIKHPIVKEIIHRHAFVTTIMATMLEVSRSVGVQASADFLWLKPVDRRLWYMLNAVGRQTPTVEVAGPFAHWLIEKRLGRKILTPMIDEAVKALEEAIKGVVYKPGEEE